MNEHPFKIKNMARVTDTSRIENLEDAAISLVVEKGYSSSSVSDIARKAGISAGYLYSHYKSKEDLVLSIYERNINIFDDYIDYIIASSSTVSEFAKQFISYMFNRANELPDLVKFLLLLVFDRTFNIPAMRLNKTREQCRQILKKGIDNGEIADGYSPEDVYIVYFSIPFKLLENRLEKATAYRAFTDADVNRVSDMCIKALQ